MVLDPANGVAKGEGGCFLMQHVWSNAVEEIDILLTFETAPFFCERTVHIIQNVCNLMTY